MKTTLEIKMLTYVESRIQKLITLIFLMNTLLKLQDIAMLEMIKRGLEILREKIDIEECGKYR